jgi:hypothetical protein
MTPLDIQFFRLKFKFNSAAERAQFFSFLKTCARSLSDDGTDVFIKRELVKLIMKLASRLQNKSLLHTLNWYEYHALKFTFNTFEIPENQVLVRVAFGKIDQALPIGLGVIKS